MCIEVSGEYRNWLSLAEVAYLAGLIDGEGTIGIYRQTGTKMSELNHEIHETPTDHRAEERHVA